MNWYEIGKGAFVFCATLGAATVVKWLIEIVCWIVRECVNAYRAGRVLVKYVAISRRHNVYIPFNLFKWTKEFFYFWWWRSDWQMGGLVIRFKTGKIVRQWTWGDIYGRD